MDEFEQKLAALLQTDSGLQLLADAIAQIKTSNSRAKPSRQKTLDELLIFVHKDDPTKIAILNRAQIRESLALTSLDIYLLTSGNRKSCKGWTYVGIYEPEQ